MGMNRGAAGHETIAEISSGKPAPAALLLVYCLKVNPAQPQGPRRHKKLAGCLSTGKTDGWRLVGVFVYFNFTSAVTQQLKYNTGRRNWAESFKNFNFLSGLITRKAGPKALIQFK